jgi:hypothetical protein
MRRASGLRRRSAPVTALDRRGDHVGLAYSMIGTEREQDQGVEGPYLDPPAGDLDPLGTVLSPLHCVQAPCLGFEFLGALLDGSVSVWRLDASEPHRLLGDLIDIPNGGR